MFTKIYLTYFAKYDRLYIKQSYERKAGKVLRVLKKLMGKRRYGGIGRRARFRIWWATVQVQVLLPVPKA